MVTGCSYKQHLVICDWIYETVLIGTRKEIQFIADH